MHFLLIPFALLSLTFIVQYAARRGAGVRGALLITATATMSLMLVAMMLRSPIGDSWRYFHYFLDLRSMGLMEALTYREPDLFYALLNWVVGRIGYDTWLLFGATLMLFFGGFIVAVRRLLGPVNTAALLMCYAAYPYFIAYAVNALRQGLTMVFLLNAYVHFRQGKRTAWVWLLLAPLWHSGAWLLVGVAALHWAMCRFVRSERARWALVLGSLLVAISLSASGLNASLIARLPEIGIIRESHLYYIETTDNIMYLSGFRIDFLLFSLLPLTSALLLQRISPTFQYSGSGWWLSIYLSLNAAYHLFSSVPFADRFASFSWFLIPLVMFLQVLETRRRRFIWEYLAFVAIVNVVILQLYSGDYIPAPQWW